MACAGENTSVTLMRMPSSVRCLPAVIPAGVIGTFTTTLSANVAKCFPWSYMAFASGSVVSRDTSPSTSSRIVRHAFSMSPCSQASSVGFVVTPLRTPQSLISRISSMLAVSRNSRMVWSPYLSSCATFVASESRLAIGAPSVIRSTTRSMTAPMAWSRL